VSDPPPDRRAAPPPGTPTPPLRAWTPPPRAPTPPERPRDVAPNLDLSVGAHGTGGGVRSPLPRDVGSGHGLGLSVGAMATGAGPTDEVVRGLPAGTVLRDRYEIQALLGVGGMGAVYRVHDRDRGKNVALKVMLPSLLAREKAVERFIHEAELTLQLSHENIIRVFDVGLDRATGLRFFTMELLEGMSLREWIEAKKSFRDPIRPDEALEITRQLLEALRYAHRTTVHRDLKPENVFVVKGEPMTVKILDFGIAKLQSAQQFTSTSMALGTAYYMAPEQQSDAASVDGRADIYSVSVILYELLTGELPVGRFKTPSEERKGLPPAIDEVVLRGLERKAEARPASADALLEELKAIRRLVEKGAGAVPGPRRRPSAAVLAGVALVVAAVGAGAAAWRTGVLDRLGGGGAPAAPAEGRAGGGPPPEAPPAPAPVARARFVDLAPASRQVLRDDPVRVRGRVQGDAVRHVEVEGVQAAVAEDGTFEVPLALREGTIALRLAAFGPGGERLGEAEHPVAVDRTPPTLAVEPPDGHATRASSVAFRGTVADASAVTVLVDGAGIALRDGRFEVERSLAGAEATFELVARDIAGNEARVRRRVVVDREAPVIHVEEPADGAFTNQASARIRGRIEDASPSHVLVGGERVDTDDGGRFEATAALAEGPNDIALSAVDRVGNAGGERTLRIHRDTVAPTLRLDPLPAGGTGGEHLSIGGEVDEDGCRVFVNGVEAAVSGRRFAHGVSLAMGERPFEVVVRDRLGNEARTTSGPVAGGDRMPPLLEMEAPADGSFTREGEARVRGRVVDAHPSHATVSGVRVEAAGDGRFEMAIALAEGANEIAIVAYDLAGTASPPRTIRVERDSRPPVVRLSPLPAKAPDTGRLEVAGDVDEDGCRVTVNGAAAAVRGRRFEVEVLLAVGENRIEVVAVDRAGGVGRASGVTRLEERGTVIRFRPRQGDRLIETARTTSAMRGEGFRSSGTLDKKTTTTYVTVENGRWTRKTVRYDREDSRTEMTVGDRKVDTPSTTPAYVGRTYTVRRRGDEAVVEDDGALHDWQKVMLKADHDCAYLFPDKPVEVGETWDATAKARPMVPTVSGATFPRYDVKVTLRELRDVAGRRSAVIDVRQLITTEIQGVTSEGDLKAETVIWLERGYPISSRVDMKVTASGFQNTFATDTTWEVLE